MILKTIGVLTFSARYPRVNEYSTYAALASQNSYVQTRFGGQVCSAPYIYGTTSAEYSTISSGGKQYATAMPELIEKGRPFINSDHVYEFSNLGNFFTHMLDQANNPNSASCSDFQAWFQPVNGPNRLATIYSYMPAILTQI